MRWMRSKTWCVTSLAFAITVLFGAASAHFGGSSDGTPELRRYILLSPSDEGLDIFIRHPAPLLFLEEMQEAIEATTSMRSLYLAPKSTEGGLRYRLLRDAISQDKEGFNALVTRALRLSQFDRSIPMEQQAIRIGGPSDEIPFSSPEAAQRSIDWPPLTEDPWLDTAVVEVHYRATPVSPMGPIELQSGLPELDLATFVVIDNHVIDARSETLAPLEIEGQFTSPMRLDGSRIRPLLSFIFQGILHILGGLDHVLFVLCLALGATHLRGLIWVITGFSVGHSLTLIAGFLGFVPSASWFIPAVESVIAASIVYAGWCAYKDRSAGLFATSALGLVHGLGFAFVLGDILGPGADALVECLIAFNVGVEIGQIGIVLAVVGLKMLIAPKAPNLWRWGRHGLIAAAMLQAAYWTVERAASIGG